LPEGDPGLQQIEIALMETGVTTGEFGRAEAYRAKKLLLQEWLADDRQAVVRFARDFIRRLDQMIVGEQREAEQRTELRKREFDDDQ
jgi:hypothetical protein